MELNVSLSALKPSQYRPFLKSWVPNKALLKVFEKISGKKGRKAMRIYFDVGHNVIKKADPTSSAPQPINDFLASKKITVLDYFAGVGRDSHGRTVRLGKVLAKEAELKKMFDSDPNRKIVAQESKVGRMVCVSMHPYDIAGMSTDRGWVSCMELTHGAERQHVKADVKNGTLIAYLIDAQDKNLNRPVSRCLLKPYFDVNDAKPRVGKKGSPVVYLADRAYPDKNATFVMRVQDWFDANINPALSNGATTLTLIGHEGLYDDVQRGDFQHDASKPTAEQNDTVYNELRYSQMARTDPKELVQQMLRITAPRNSLIKTLADLTIDHFDVVADLLKERWAYPAFPQRVIDAITGVPVPSKQLALANRFLAFVKKNWGRTEARDLQRTAENCAPIALGLALIADPDTDMRQKIRMVSMYNRSEQLMGAYPNALTEIWANVQQVEADKREAAFWEIAQSVSRTFTTPMNFFRADFDMKDMEMGTAVTSLYFERERPDPVPPVANNTLMRRYITQSPYFEPASKVMSGFTPLNINLYTEIRGQLKDNVMSLGKKEHRAALRRFEGAVNNTSILEFYIKEAAKEAGVPVAEMMFLTEGSGAISFLSASRVPGTEYATVRESFLNSLMKQFTQQ